MGSTEVQAMAAVQQAEKQAPAPQWTVARVEALMALPLPELMHQAQLVHRAHFDPCEVEFATLLSVKTGGCAENCGYCSQSAFFDTGLKAEKLMALEREETQAIYGQPRPYSRPDHHHDHRPDGYKRHDDDHRGGAYGYKKKKRFDLFDIFD